ncbi:hypothetical protein Tco_1538180 [Tanacetum coccineum]
MKESSLMLTMLIPGPKSPAKDIDVYLQPLIKELQELWKGVWTKDAATGTYFEMKAALLWTINDFPARSSLSGWSGQGYYDAHCNETLHRNVDGLLKEKDQIIPGVPVCLNIDGQTSWLSEIESPGNVGLEGFSRGGFIKGVQCDIPRLHSYRCEDLARQPRGWRSSRKWFFIIDDVARRPIKMFIHGSQFITCFTLSVGLMNVEHTDLSTKILADRIVDANRLLMDQCANANEDIEDVVAAHVLATTVGIAGGDPPNGPTGRNDSCQSYFNIERNWLCQSGERVVGRYVYHGSRLTIFTRYPSAEVVKNICAAELWDRQRTQEEWTSWLTGFPNPDQVARSAVNAATARKNTIPTHQGKNHLPKEERIYKSESGHYVEPKLRVEKTHSEQLQMKAMQDQGEAESSVHENRSTNLGSSRFLDVYDSDEMAQIMRQQRARKCVAKKANNSLANNDEGASGEEEEEEEGNEGTNDGDYSEENEEEEEGTDGNEE